MRRLALIILLPVTLALPGCLALPGAGLGCLAGITVRRHVGLPPMVLPGSLPESLFGKTLS